MRGEADDRRKTGLLVVCRRDFLTAYIKTSPEELIRNSARYLGLVIDTRLSFAWDKKFHRLAFLDLRFNCAEKCIRRLTAFAQFTTCTPKLSEHQSNSNLLQKCRLDADLLK